MRKIAIAFAATTAMVFVGSLAWQAAAQTTRGASEISSVIKNFTPIEKAACGPFWGRWCGPWHHRVCNPWGCWCAHC
jgi:hypothetical protein